MSVVKRAIKKSFSLLGYELRSKTLPVVRYENFLNLAAAYERRINEEQELIVPNDTRLKLLARLQGTPPSEAYFIIQALAQCKDIPGDVCELGVAQGETSALIANEMAPWSDKRLHLFDSFTGLPKPSEKDQLKDDIFALGSIEAYAGTMAYPEDLVRHRLAAVSFPPERCVIHRGFFEQVVQEDSTLPEKVSFAYVDFDFYEPIKLALEFLHRVTPTGAILIVDDYDYFSTGVKTAVDEFLELHHTNEVTYDCYVPDVRSGNFAILTKKHSRMV